MRITSIRRGYECDHSTRDYGYISGIRVYYDYGIFEMTFMVPYNTELFEMLQKCGNINYKKRFNKIEVTLYLYCEDLGEDELEYVDLAHEIRGDLINKNTEVTKLLDAYHGESNDFENIETKTETGKRLQKLLTAKW